MSFFIKHILVLLILLFQLVPDPLTQLHFLLKTKAKKQQQNPKSQTQIQNCEQTLKKKKKPAQKTTTAHGVHFVLVYKKKKKLF